MPHPKVVKMRRRLMRIMKLAEKAAKNAGKGEVCSIINAWERGELSYEEALEKLKALAEARE